MLQIKVTSTDPFVDELRALQANLSKELGVAVWKTARWGKSQAAKSAAKRINLPQKTLRKVIGAKRLDQTTAVFFIRSSRRDTGISMKHFRPKQTKKGVSVAAYKRGGGRVLLPRAFLSHGKVYQRIGKPRRPIKQVRYPKTHLQFVHTGLLHALISGARQRLSEEIQARVRYLTHKAAGTLRGKQPVEIK